jgi:PAS domain S-box-containing protein
MQRSELSTILDSADGRAVADALLQTTPSIAVIADSEGRILRVSRHACELSGLSAHEMEGLRIEEFFALVEPRGPDGRLLKIEQFPLVGALKGRAQLGRQGFFRDGRGERVPIVSNVAPFRSPTGEVIGAISSVTDLRDLRAVEARLRAAITETELLYRELAHRVKNHLQVMAGLVALECRQDPPDAHELAAKIGQRLQVLAAIYDSMNDASRGGRVPAGAFLEQAVEPFRSERVQIAVTAPADATFAPEHAGPLGMLVNEAVCNSYKHAFPQRQGRIAVALGPAAHGRVALEVADDGVGFTASANNGMSQGVRLMRLLARQLGGELGISTRRGGGARIVVQLPISIGLEPQVEKRGARARRRPPTKGRAATLARSRRAG